MSNLFTCLAIVAQILLLSTLSGCSTSSPPVQTPEQGLPITEPEGPTARPAQPQGEETSAGADSAELAKRKIEAGKKAQIAVQAAEKAEEAAEAARKAAEAAEKAGEVAAQVAAEARNDAESARKANEAAVKAAAKAKKDEELANKGKEAAAQAAFKAQKEAEAASKVNEAAAQAAAKEANAERVRKAKAAEQAEAERVKKEKAEVEAKEALAAQANKKLEAEEKAKKALQAAEKATLAAEAAGKAAEVAKKASEAVALAFAKASQEAEEAERVRKEKAAQEAEAERVRKQKTENPTDTDIESFFVPLDPFEPKKINPIIKEISSKSPKLALQVALVAIKSPRNLAAFKTIISEFILDESKKAHLQAIYNKIIEIIIINKASFKAEERLGNTNHLLDMAFNKISYNPSPAPPGEAVIDANNISKELAIAKITKDEALSAKFLVIHKDHWFLDIFERNPFSNIKGFTLIKPKIWNRDLLKLGYINDEMVLYSFGYEDIDPNSSHFLVQENILPKSFKSIKPLNKGSEAEVFELEYKDQKFAIKVQLDHGGIAGSSVYKDFAAIEKAWFTGALVPVYGYYESELGTAMVMGLGKPLKDLIQNKFEFNKKHLFVSLMQMNRYCDISYDIGAYTQDIKIDNMVQIDNEIRLIDIGNKIAETHGIQGSCSQKVARALFQAYNREFIKRSPIDTAYEKYGIRIFCTNHLHWPDCDTINSQEFFNRLSLDDKAKILTLGYTDSWYGMDHHPIISKTKNPSSWSKEYFEQKDSIGKELCQKVWKSSFNENEYINFTQYCDEKKFKKDAFKNDDDEFKSWIMEIVKLHLLADVWNAIFRDVIGNKYHEAIAYDEAVFNFAISKMPESNFKKWLEHLNKKN